MGTPDDVADAITAWENVGFDGINFIHQFMEVVPQQYVLDSMRLFAEEVMPRFKDVTSSASATRRPVGGGGGLMPLAGSLDIRPLVSSAPEVVLDDRVVQVDDVDILQVLYEVRVADRESLLPPALNPTIPPVISFLVFRAKESVFGPFALAQLRLTARAGVRPRAYLVSARCDNPALTDVLERSYGFRVAPGTIALRRFHDRIDCLVRDGDEAGGGTILDVSLVDPVPVTGHDVQYPPGMHLARIARDGVLVPRIVQVDSEYVFRRADRGQPVLTHFDPGAWGDPRLVPYLPVSASFAACDVTIANVRYVCNPDIPASEGTEKVSDT